MSKIFQLDLHFEFIFLLSLNMTKKKVAANHNSDTRQDVVLCSTNKLIH